MGMNAGSLRLRAGQGPKRSIETKEAIIAAAADLVGDRGYMATSLEAVAQSAGASKQTIYRWWGSKPALFMEVYEELVPVAGLVQEAETPRATLLARLRELFRIYRETPAGQIFAGLIVEAQSDPVISATLRARFVGERAEILRGPLQAARSQGQLPADHDLPFTVDLILGAIWFRLLQGAPPPDDALAEALVRRLLGDEA